MTNLQSETIRKKRKDKSPSTAILLVDVINDLQFPNGHKFKKSFTEMTKKLEPLLEQARRHSVPIIYVNDNWGKWRSDIEAQIRHATREQSVNRDNVLRILPQKNDSYILKPKHSAFYATATDLILKDLNIETLILCGISTESCILFTATDAYLHSYKLILPKDCLASESKAKLQKALAIMKESLHAKVLSSTELNFSKNHVRVPR